MMLALKLYGVVTKPDVQKGRGMKFEQSDVKKYALEKNLAVFEPEKVKENQEIIDKLKELEPDITKRNIRYSKERCNKSSCFTSSKI